MLPNEVVILGGGASVVKGIEQGLFERIPSLFCIGLNYTFKFIETTAVLGIDETFYNENHMELMKLPIYIGKDHFSLKRAGHDAYFFPKAKDYSRNLIPGVYSPTLAGLFALSLFIRLIDKGTIYLLGYDYGPTKNAEGKTIMLDGLPLTHWYQGKCKHRGVGKVNWYEATLLDYDVTGKRISNAEKEFRPYVGETDVKIVIVGQSNIPYFEHISYEEFFTKTSTTVHNQEALRAELKKSLNSLEENYRLQMVFHHQRKRQ